MSPTKKDGIKVMENIFAQFDELYQAAIKAKIRIIETLDRKDMHPPRNTCEADSEGLNVKMLKKKIWGFYLNDVWKDEIFRVTHDYNPEGYKSKGFSNTRISFKKGVDINSFVGGYHRSLQQKKSWWPEISRVPHLASIDKLTEALIGCSFENYDLMSSGIVFNRRYDAGQGVQYRMKYELSPDIDFCYTLIKGTTEPLTECCILVTGHSEGEVYGSHSIEYRHKLEYDDVEHMNDIFEPMVAHALQRFQNIRAK